MTTRAYRSECEPAPNEDASGFEREVLFVGVIVWMASLADVVGIAARNGSYSGLHAVALVVFAALLLVLVREVARRAGRGADRSTRPSPRKGLLEHRRRS